MLWVGEAGGLLQVLGATGVPIQAARDGRDEAHECVLAPLALPFSTLRDGRGMPACQPVSITPTPTFYRGTLWHKAPAVCLSAPGRPAAYSLKSAALQQQQQQQQQGSSYCKAQAHPAAAPLLPPLLQ